MPESPSHRVVPAGRPGGDRILLPDEMGRADAHAIEVLGIPGVALMENASRHVAAAVAERVEPGAPVLVLCGGGNNGGDGLAAARHLAGWGHRVAVRLVRARETYTGDAATNLAICEAMGLDVEVLDGPPGGARPALIVDALLGTGLSGDVRGVAKAVIEWVGAQRAPVVAVDIPSGVDGATGAVLGVAIEAVETVTFSASKPGHWLHPGAGHRGALRVVDIGMPPSALDRAPRRRVLGAADLASVRRPRALDAHKGTQGHVYVLGGSVGKSGSIRMCGDAALRAGAGLVTLGTTPSVARALGPVLYETMAEGALDLEADEDGSALVERLGGFDAIAVGPGLPTEPAYGALLEAVLPALARPVVIDADGLNHLARRPAIGRGAGARVITPHPGEAARLLGTDARAVQRDRLGAAAALHAKYGAVVVLKGAGTIVHAEDEVCICPAGNPGMASAGMGDVLTGIIAALLGRGLSAAEAARAGVLWHARAGDVVAARTSQDHLVAGDVIAALAEGARERPC